MQNIRILHSYKKPTIEEFSKEADTIVIRRILAIDDVVLSQILIEEDHHGLIKLVIEY